MDEYVRDNYRIFFPEDPIANIPGVLFDYEHTGIALGIISFSIFWSDFESN